VTGVSVDVSETTEITVCTISTEFTERFAFRGVENNSVVDQRCELSTPAIILRIIAFSTSELKHYSHTSI